MQKSFWKRHESLIVALLTLLFIYIFVVFHQKVNFLLGNELLVYLSPQQKSFEMHYGDISKASFDVSISNVAYCRASCSYAFTDRSINNVVDKGNFEIEKSQHFLKSYELSVKRLGSGQDIYSFEVGCRSIRSLLCLTKGDEKFRSSLAIVNYDLTETEKELKKILKQNVTKLLGMLADADMLNQQMNQKYFELAHKVNLNSLSRQKISINDAYDKVRISIENLRSLWAIENYLKLNQLFNESFFYNLNGIENSIKDMDKEMENIVGLHNSLLSQLGFLSKGMGELYSFIGVSDNETLNSFFANINEFNAISSSITNNTFENYDAITKKIDGTTKQQKLIIEKSKIPAQELFFDSEYSLRFADDFLCSLRNCDENTSAAAILSSTGEFIRNYPNADALTALRQNCNSLKELEQKYAAIRNDTLRVISDKNISFPPGNEFLGLAGSFKENEIRKINNSYYESFEKIKLENKTSPEVIEIAGKIFPKNKTELMQLSYNESINLSLYLLSKIELFFGAYELTVSCSKLEVAEPAAKIGSFSFEPVSPLVNYTVTSKIETNLSDNPPICCVFNDCKPCCRDESCANEPKTFPVIFLHGHSLAEGNSPDFSLDSFNSLQSKLQEDGYLNTGIVSLYSKNEQVQKGVWGLSGKPITVKASYYYDAFRKDDKYIVVPTKSENIDAYALRLKDLINIVKERTGKPKVNIIAHSMGGLVARRYLQIFGEENIDKLVMIAAPNKGISGAISDYCGFIGESRECEDMQENSLFINKLNELSKQPAKVKLYAIVGQGCQMKLGDGDGIVLLSNAKLENAKTYTINGTCSFGEILHTQILNIESYPETYNLITEILRD